MIGSRISCIVLWVIFSLVVSSVFAQQPVVQYQQPQPKEVLTLTEVLDIVRKFHPVARRANLIVDSAEANRLAVRGAFDPAVTVYNAAKTFNGKNYYFYTNPEIKIPTWYGLEFKAGFENNGGDRMDPELTPGRSSYTGVSIPLARNLLIDRRRASLEQARILIQQSEADRLNAYNDLLFGAAETYWDWVREYQILSIIRSTVQFNRQRLDLVRRAYLGGERAAIDTVEVLAQLQNFQFMEADAYLRWVNTGLELSNFLWLDQDQPYRLPLTVIPDTTWVKVNIDNYPLPVLEETLQNTFANHPKLRSLDFKVDILEVERRLKFQNLLPRINFNYNFLNPTYQPWKGIGSNVFENNYKYGFEFGIPLFQRQARGELKLARIKIDQTVLQRSQTVLEIENKVKAYYNQVLTLRQQIDLIEAAYNNYVRLLRAEELRFSIGESSLFLINTRETRVLDAMQKLMELKTKFFKSLVALQWASGSI